MSFPCSLENASYLAWKSDFSDEFSCEFSGEVSKKDSGYIELKSNRPPKKLFNHYFEVDSSGNGLAEKWAISDLHCECRDYDHEDDFAVSVQAEDNQIDEGHEFSSYEDVLLRCFEVLSLSPTANLMVKEASMEGWQIALADLSGGDYWIDVEEKLVLLDNNALMPFAFSGSLYFQNVLTVNLIKALRDLWQEKRHGGFDDKYRAEHVITMERVRAADCDVVSILVGWELRCEDYPDIWRHLIGSENGDLAMVFSGAMERNPSSQFDGHALACVFAQWFRCENRVNICDHNTLEYLDDILSDCKEQNPFGNAKPAKLNVEMLSCLPDKTAYLQGHGGEILSNPLYCGMDDQVNQTHLFHILHDVEAVIVENVPFRDEELARKIFPTEQEENDGSIKDKIIQDSDF